MRCLIRPEMKRPHGLAATCPKKIATECKLKLQDGHRVASMFVGLGLLVVTIGCSRHHYRVRADHDAYGRIIEKVSGTPWMPPRDFSVYPAPHSRLYHPTSLEDPCLPIPSPQLHSYELPQLTPRDSGRFRPEQERHSDGPDVEMLPEPAPTLLQPGDPPTEQPPPPPKPPIQVQSVSYRSDGENRPNLDRSILIARLPAVENASDEDLQGDQPATSSLVDAQTDPTIVPDEISPLDESTDDTVLEPSFEEPFDDSPRTRQVPLPASYWEAIPPDCLSRMLEFESVRREYAVTFGASPSPSLMDDSPRLALEDIVELTLLNSRELQAQKEALYRVALALTLERFDYQLKPSLGANGSAADYTHNRSQRITDDLLRIPTTFQLDKMLYTGGDFLGRFANDVLLTFNGPQGFAVDVGSELLFSLSQSLLQRDVRFENLTQAERNVVYAARDFTRFRKELFVQQASDYYSLILQYRQIEINCQNYFTLAREFNQRSVEIRFGMAARTQLDQVEQQVITGRQSILSTCTALENALDSLKIRMGIPTEQPLNLDLSELNLLTLRDELAVNAELIERTRARITRERQSESRSAFVLLGSLAQLVEQMLDSYRLREQLGEQPPDVAPVEDLLLELRIEAADIDIAENQADLEEELAEEAPDPTKVIQRRRDVADEILKKVDWQIRLLRRTADDRSTSDLRIEQLRQFTARLSQLAKRFREVIFSEQEGNADRTEEAQLVREAELLQRDLESVAAELDRTIGRPEDRGSDNFMNRAIAFSEKLLQDSASFRDAAGGGLVPIQIDMDDAMMTALVQRFDLMNERGFLADDWRQIKYAADDLRSALNLQASQSIRTRSGQNRPFDFTFDDSTTSVGVTLDLPFNRRAQRNLYRSSLFDYQAALRRLMQLEDNVKLAIRRELRQLTLDRQQYGNDVAGAALASERVTGTELEVRGGFATSRDFLESQTAYVQAVSGVASRHINYIVGRLELFLDLESLTVGENGFWDELYDENHQPQPLYQLQLYGRPAYGNLPPRLRYSAKIRRMECVPPGISMVHRMDHDAPERSNSADSTVEAIPPGIE